MPNIWLGWRLEKWKALGDILFNNVFNGVGLIGTTFPGDPFYDFILIGVGLSNP